MPELVHTVEVRPAFYDLDPMGVVWHGHYLKFFELARTALLQRHGFDYPVMQATGYLWPVVDLRLKYVRPARLHQALAVRAEITEFECRLRVDYLITDAGSGERLTKGYTVQVAVDAATGALQYVCPKILWTCLGVTP
jgi:acyl-CoA thioester hydrolase